jgi:hypothetical protein
MTCWRGFSSTAAWYFKMVKKKELCHFTVGVRWLLLIRKPKFSLTRYSTRSALIYSSNSRFTRTNLGNSHLAYPMLLTKHSVPRRARLRRDWNSTSKFPETNCPIMHGLSRHCVRTWTGFVLKRIRKSTSCSRSSECKLPYPQVCLYNDLCA